MSKIKCNQWDFFRDTADGGNLYGVCMMPMDNWHAGGHSDLGTLYPSTPVWVVICAIGIAPKWANYIDLHLEFDEDGKLFTRLHDKRDDFDFPIVNCPYLMRHICWMVCSLTVAYDWFPVIWGKSWQVPNVGPEMPTLSGTPDFTPFGEFMISPIHYKLV